MGYCGVVGDIKGVEKTSIILGFKLCVVYDRNDRARLAACIVRVWSMAGHGWPPALMFDQTRQGTFGPLPQLWMTWSLAGPYWRPGVGLDDQAIRRARLAACIWHCSPGQKAGVGVHLRSQKPGRAGCGSSPAHMLDQTRQGTFDPLPQL